MENKELNTMVQNILQNPEFASLVKEIKGSEAEIDTGKIMAKLPEMMQLFGLSEKSDNHTIPSETAGTETTEPPRISPNPSENANFPLSRLIRPGSKDKRDKLLCALKPYLSPARCSLIDKAMNAMQLGEVLSIMQTPPTSGSEKSD